MNKRTTTEILADALDYVERHGPAKLGVELREVYRQSIGESPPDDNRWRSVAEQAEKALRFYADQWWDSVDGWEPTEKLADDQGKKAEEALAAFDSLRKEHL